MDKRDLRDPQKLGEMLLADHANAPHWPFHEIYDQGKGKNEIPDYSHEESLCDVTQREYREELESRAAEGDKYAASALEQLNKGERVENDDPSGT